MHGSAQSTSIGSTPLTAATTFLWVSDSPVPANVAAAVGPAGLRPLSPADPIGDHADGVRVALVYTVPAEPNIRLATRVIEQLQQRSVMALALANGPGCPLARLLGRYGHLAVVEADAPPALLAGYLSALSQLQPALAARQQELTRIRSLGSGLGRTFGEIEEEMRLAARLQRDLLPKEMPALAAVRFSAMWRPASWVSGDIYDATRLDERRIGFYVADAVGHGVPAALLTILIRQSLPTKRIRGRQYELVSPEKAMSALNEALVDQDLSSCQFCTAVYGVIDTETLELTYARGGHPEPLLLTADGRTTELDAPGPLLGILPEATFQLGRVQLAPGDRVVIHTDGAEDTFRTDTTAGRSKFVAAVEQARHLPVDEMTLQLSAMIDDLQGSLHPEDDITMLVLDIAK